MVMPAYAAMLLHINYAQIHASIIRQGLNGLPQDAITAILHDTDFFAGDSKNESYEACS